jgi:hypothetical protein
LYRKKYRLTGATGRRTKIKQLSSPAKIPGLTPPTWRRCNQDKLIREGKVDSVSNVLPFCILGDCRNQEEREKKLIMEQRAIFVCGRG